MTLIRWSPGWDPFNQMEDMMRQLAGSQSKPMTGFTPALDVYEEDGKVMVQAPLAGVRPEDVEITVERGVLTLKGEMKKEHEVDDKNYYRKETRRGSFFRQVALPASVEEENVTAEFEDGILRIACPKKTPTASKKINVQVVKKNK